MLAGIMGFNMEEIQYFSVDSDPVRKVLTKWSMLYHEQATTDKLIHFLEEMGRMDVIHDIKCYVDKALTLEQYQTRQLEFQSASSKLEYDTSPATLNESYDVFISYAKPDLEFAKEILQTLEDNYHITACIDYRDFLPGFHPLDQVVEAIENRCRKVIVIFTQEFFDNENCEFQAKVAMSLSPGSKRRILIPVLYKPCDIPSLFNGIFFLNYTDEDYRKNFWEKLKVSIVGR